MELVQHVQEQYDRVDNVHEQQERPKRSSWPATAELRRPAPPPRFLHWVDCKLLAAAAAIMLLGFLFTCTDYGTPPQLSSTTAHLASPFSTSYDRIQVHSSVLDINFTAEVMLLEFRVEQQGPAVATACRASNAADFQLTVGTAEQRHRRPTAVIPLCPQAHHADPSDNNTAAATAAAPQPAAIAPPPAPAGAAGVEAYLSSSSNSSGQHAVYVVALPIRQINFLSSPWEQLATTVRLSLRCAGMLCTARNTPALTWTAHWALEHLQLSTVQHMLRHAVPLLEAADAYPIDELSNDFLEEAGLQMAMPEATFSVEAERRDSVRVLQLAVGLCQLGFIVYCLAMGVGQLVWAYVMHRLLCMRMHVTQRRTSSGGLA